MVSHKATHAHKRRLPLGWGIIIALLVVLVAGLGTRFIAASPHASPPHRPTVTAPAPPTAVVVTGYRHVKYLFDSGQPGTAEATAALSYAAANHVILINYSFLNVPITAGEAYLVQAHQLGALIIISAKDLLPPGNGDFDKDPTDRLMHANYGRTNDERIRAIVHRYDSYPALFGYYLTDETPIDASEFGKWKPQLMLRYAQFTALSHKYVISSYYENPLSFLHNVKPFTQGLMMDYYPYPEGGSQSNGPMGDIQQVAQITRAAAGVDSVFAIQAVSFSPELKPAGSNQGAPRAGVMMAMGKAALQGGVCNLALFSYDLAAAIPGQLDELSAAIRQIRQLPDYSHCSS